MTDWWWAWGLGWLFMPRMTIGLILMLCFPGYWYIGLVLTILGALFDVGSGVKVTSK
jgi:hypothetical protein